MIFLILILVSFISPRTFAHGEDKPGPHGGFIKMPGAYHTEIVPLDKNSLNIFLIDMEWKNALIKDSQVKVIHMNSKKEAQCKPQADFFHCEFPKGIDLTSKGEIVVSSQRLGQKGNDVIYKVPLKIGVHSGHH